MTTPPIQLRDVGYSSGPTPVLDSGNLRLDEGDLLGVIGPNAGGTTTML